MRNRLIWASATLALVIAACGNSSPTSSASPANSCVNASAAHHAYVVVEHLSGATVQKCVGFTGATIDGKTLMDQSGIPYQTQTFPGVGLGVCAVDSEPKQFTECFPKGQPAWWLWTEASGTWTAAPVGFDQLQLHDTDAIGWRYVPASDASPSPPPVAKES